MVYVLRKVKTGFILLKSIFIQFCIAKWDFLETNTLSDRWPSAFGSLRHPHSVSHLSQNHLLTAHSKSVVSSEFFQTLGKCSTPFLFENCPLGFLFPINYFFVDTSSWSNIQRASSPFEVYRRWWSPQFFSYVWREPSTMGSEIKEFLFSRWYIFYTILLYIFLRVWSIANWMLPLEYWKLGHASSMKTTLQSIWNKTFILLFV